MFRKVQINSMNGNHEPRITNPRVENLTNSPAIACDSRLGIGDSESHAMPSRINQRLPRRLHIGGRQKHPEWEILNAVAAPEVDHIGNANDLSRFEESTFAAIYGSHIVEHLDYKGELSATLKEWHRVLEPGGKLYVSVPDLEVLSHLFIDKERLRPEDRFMVMRMMFGGHVDEYDYHVVGLNDEFLASYLTGAGFPIINRVENFGIFADTSAMLFKGVHISLNMIAEKGL